MRRAAASQDGMQKFHVHLRSAGRCLSAPVGRVKVTVCDSAGGSGRLPVTNVAEVSGVQGVVERLSQARQLRSLGHRA